MSDKTAIEWTDATWNPTAGCSIVSPGCTNCYAMKMAARIERMNPAARHYRGLTQPSKAGPVWTGTVRWPDPIPDQPLRWKKPRRIFVNSMSDLFHDDVPDEVIDRVFAIMALAPQHTFQVLTKRAERMRQWFAERWQGTPARDLRMPDGEVLHIPAGGETGRRHQVEQVLRDFAEERNMIDPDIDSQWDEKGRLKIAMFDWPFPNVWLGVSVEDQARADERIPHLLATPAAKRFLSCEPLLGPVDLNPYLFIITHADEEHLAITPPGMVPELPWNDPKTTPSHEISTPRLDWVIAGGESGPKARPSHPDWFRTLRDQCQAAEVPFFFKQWGEWRHAPDRAHFKELITEGWQRVDSQKTGVRPAFVVREGKKAAGATLDGREWREFPA